MTAVSHVGLSHNRTGRLKNAGTIRGKPREMEPSTLWGIQLFATSGEEVSAVMGEMKIPYAVFKIKTNKRLMLK